jgi:hypothetical protein
MKEQRLVGRQAPVISIFMIQEFGTKFPITTVPRGAFAFFFMRMDSDIPSFGDSPEKAVL